MNIQVRRWSTRVSVSPAHADHPWQAWCARLVRGPVGRRLLQRIAQSLPRPHAASVDDMVVVVRALRLRVRVLGQPDDASVANTWAEGLLHDLVAGLEGASALPRGGRSTDRVAVFPRPLDAEAAALQLSAATDAPAPWWAPQILQGRAPAEIFATWIATHPAEAAATLLEISGGRPAALAAWVDAATAEALHSALDAAWQHRRAWVAPAPAPPTPSIDPAHLALLLACETRALRAAAAPLALQPAVTEFEPSAALDAPSSPDQPRVPESQQGEHEQPDTVAVDLAGLLLLVRPLCRHPQLAQLPWPQWAGALNGIWAAIDKQLFACFDPELADAIRRANAPVIAAFTVEQTPTTVSVEAAEQVLADLCATLDPAPLPMEPLPDRLARRLVGPWPDRWRPLIQVVLRPGHLRLTDTHADLHLPLDSVDLTLRRNGWDLDPGFVPGFRRVIRFHYQARAQAP